MEHPGPKERHLETLLHNTLHSIILTRLIPRTLVQVTLQIRTLPEEEESTGVNTVCDNRTRTVRQRLIQAEPYYSPPPASHSPSRPSIRLHTPLDHPHIRSNRYTLLAILLAHNITPTTHR